MFSAIGSLITSGNGTNLLLFMVLLPSLCGLIALIIPERKFAAKSLVLIIAAVLDLLFAIALFLGEDMTFVRPWAGFEVNLALRLYPFAKFMLLGVGGFALLAAFYSASYMRGKRSGAQFFFYLNTLALANGAFLANNLEVMLFFWEAMMLTMFGMIICGRKQKNNTAVKALVMTGVYNLLLTFGVAALTIQAGTAMMDVITGVPLEGLGLLGFICMMIGAVGKIGALPFHSWMVDAAEDAPLPFITTLIVYLDKMLGVYLLVRLVVDFFDFQPGSGMSTLMMIVGAVTLLVAACMAFVQTDLRRMLAYQATSQAGFMILAIGTALPIGILGGLFFLFCFAIYDTCMFFAVGSIEKQTGTTDLREIGGLGRVMPVTAICFGLAVLALCGVPGFSGFFALQMVLNASAQANVVYCIIAFVGLFLTAATFIKVTHGVFFGQLKPADGTGNTEIHEAPGAMLLPMIILAVSGLVFGILNALPLKALEGILGSVMGQASYIGWPDYLPMVLIMIAVLIFAVLCHVIVCRKSGSALHSMEKVRSMPVLRQVYDLAEERYFDPYNILMTLFNIVAFICFYIDRAINWVYDVFFVKLVQRSAQAIHSFNTGEISKYIAWVIAGFAFLVAAFILLI